MINSKLPRSTKIVATIGTATDETQIIKFNTNWCKCLSSKFQSWKPWRSFKKNYIYGTAEKEMNVNVAILADLQGPKFRIGAVKNETKVIKGSNYVFDKIPEIGDFKGVNLPHEEIFKSLSIGSNILWMMENYILKSKI